MSYAICRHRNHCVDCRTNAKFRASLFQLKRVPSANFTCPYGITVETAPAIQAEALAKIPAYAEMIERRNEGGRKAWRWLHEESRAGRLTWDRIKKEFWPMIPNYGCSCSARFKKIVEENPFREADQFTWTWEVHNAVNRELAPPKPEITLDEAWAIWDKKA
jgi:hypothetical protein